MLCSGVLKLCDMGLARFFKPEDAAYTPRVVTLWCGCASELRFMPHECQPCRACKAAVVQRQLQLTQVVVS